MEGEMGYFDAPITSRWALRRRRHWLCVRFFFSRKILRLNMTKGGKVPLNGPMNWTVLEK